ncbi:MAG: hypothetical protein KatS3mg015_2095 [Fimbriimonadales bacterium]|nr:MAG: hypothetical protein KatS3mg015_2095 [Fimbriimonadales bacterium]
MTEHDRTENGETSTNGDLPRVQFRPASKGRVKEAEDKPATSKPTGEKRSSRRPPKKAPAKKTSGKKAPAKRQPRQKKERTPAVEQKPATLPIEPPIPTPEGAPRVVVREGRSLLVVDGKAVAPFFFFGNPCNEKALKITLDQVKKAAEAGVHLFSMMLEFRVDEQGAQNALDAAIYLLKRIGEVDPDAKVVYRVVFAPPEGWQKRFPDAVFHYADGTLAEPSVCDNEFWGEAATYLRGFVRALRRHDAQKRVIGIHLDRGEWFFADGWGYDTSRAAERAFRDWARRRYNNDRVLLQSAWFDGSVTFDTITIPDYFEHALDESEFLLARRKERRWVDYHLFLSDATVERIGKLAREVKEASEGWYLVGVSYGYTFEWAHPANAHLSLGKLLRNPHVNIVGGPPSYRDRGMGGAAPFPGPIDSVPLNGKLFLSEEDFKTPISGAQEPDDFNPVMPTPQELAAAHWRSLGSAIAHGCGIQWMDLWGHGWLNTKAIWERAAKVREIMTLAMGAPVSDPEVAVLIDERSLAYLADPRAFKLLIQDSREAVLRAGVSAGFYLLTDLAHRKRFPDAKLYIFLNAWDIRPEVRSAIRNRLQRNGKTLFWVYSAGQFEWGRPALPRVREVTGVAIRPQPFKSRAGTTILKRDHPLTKLLEERALSTVEQLEPSYFAIPEEDTIVLGEYNQTGLPSFVVREIENEEGGWRTVFLGEPIVTERIIRGLCEYASVQIWNHHGDVVHCRPPFLTIHYKGDGHRIATLPDRWHAYDLVKGETVAVDQTHIRSDATDGATQVLLAGEVGYVRALLEADPEELAKVDQTEIEETDTVADREGELDVPLLTLPQDEHWAAYLALEDEPEEPEDTEREAKKRREARRRPRKAVKRPLKASSDTEEIGFVFRPRKG